MPRLRAGARGVLASVVASAATSALVAALAAAVRTGAPDAPDPPAATDPPAASDPARTVGSATNELTLAQLDSEQTPRRGRSSRCCSRSARCRRRSRACG